MTKATAIIVAAGSSTRMGFDKIFADLRGKSVLQYSLEAFAAAAGIGEIIVVTRRENMARVREMCGDCAIVEGGADRAQSVQNGIAAINRERGVVAIHDGARPLITPALIDAAVAAAREHGAAILAVPVKDTIKRAAGGYAADTPDRESLFAAQTPQVFDLAAYRAASENAGDVTDDAMFLERAGVKVRIVAGDYRNIKITTAEDLKIAEVLLNEHD
jgi:2-C-methyl-D-erythritol 4-phosphate cytidylyltransferase